MCAGPGFWIVLTRRFLLYSISVIVGFACILVMELTPVVSDSIFDGAAPEPAFYISNITEWRKDIPTPLVAGQDLLFSEFQDMHSSEPFELKDTASECSMDSAYQSQTSASRRGMKRPQPRSRESHNTHLSSDIYSPSMSSDSYTYQDMSQLQLPTSASSWEAPEGSMAFANFSAGQDFPLYPTSTQFTPTPTVNMSMQWGNADSQYQNSAFNLPAYPMSQPMFNNITPAQRQWSGAHIATERPTSVRTSSFTAPQNSRRTPSHDAGFAAFVASPVSTASVQLPQVDFEQQYQDQRYDGLFPLSCHSTNISRVDNEDSTITSTGAQSLNEQEDTLSLGDASETRFDEERTKVARNHILYQQGPDKDGKYHCPEEGKAGCTHKPTSLKCNYDKFVDSHLKPFRCNKKSCIGVQFSSTACLLRHEREAHGMHGHGARPHLCQFLDCDRSTPGHGFPRRYNLFDHMKRVHQYDGPTTETSASSVQGQPQRKPVSRKRKSGAEESTEKRQKVVKISLEEQLQQRRDQLAQEFLSKKQNIISFLADLAGPSDLHDDIHLSQEVMELHGICNKFRSSYGG
jgi:hypothetical protein